MAKKREEVASRSPVVTPRRPLTENNPKPLGSTLVRNGATDVTIPVRTASATSVPAVPPKSVFYEKLAKQASLQQKECFIELGEARNALKPTPKKRELLQSGEKGVAHWDNVGCDEPKLKKVVREEDVKNTDGPSVKVCILVTNIVVTS